MKKQQRPPPLSPSKFYRDDMFRVVHNVVLGAEAVEEGEVMFVGSVGGTSRSGGSSSVSAPLPRPQPRPQPMNDRRPPRMNSIRGNIWKRNKVVATEPPPSGTEATAVIDISDGDDDDQDLTIIRDDTRKMKKKRMMRNSNSLKPIRRNNMKKKVLVVKKEKVYEKPFVSFVDFMAQGSFEIQPESTVNPSNATTTTTTTAQYYDNPFGSKSSTVNNSFKNNFNSLGELGDSIMPSNQAQQLPIGQYRQDSVVGGSLEPGGGGGGFFHGEQQPLMDSDGWRLTSLQNVKFNSYQNGFQPDSLNYRCLPISTENRELFAPLRQCFDSLAILEDGVDGGQSSGELSAYRAEFATREELKRQHWQMYQSSGGEVIKQEELVQLKSGQEFKGRGLIMNKIGTPRQSPRRSKVITSTKPMMSTPVMVRPMQGQVNSYRNMSLEQVRLLHAFKVKCALESNDLRSPSSGKVITVLKSSKVQGQVVSGNKMAKSTEELLSIRQGKSVEARDLQPLMSEVQTPRRSSRKVNAVSISSTQGQVVDSTVKVVPKPQGESRDLGPSSQYTESPRRSARKVIMTERAKCAGLTLAKVTRGQDRSYN